MPELPEVETITRQLNRRLKNKAIKKVDVFLSKMVRSNLNAFKKVVKNAKIKKVSRRGKLVLIEISNGNVLVVHLKLSGQLIFQKEKQKKNKHTHTLYHFKDGSRLLHNDLRQFEGNLLFIFLNFS